jgi:hypothetical protein
MISHEIIQFFNHVLQYRVVTLQLSVYLSELRDNKFNGLSPLEITYFKGFLHVQALLLPFADFTTEILIVTL